MKLKSINPESLGAPKGYSNGILVGGNLDLLFVAGQIGWDEKQRLVSQDFAAQFDRALANILTIVAEAKGLPEHVVRMTIYVADKREYESSLKQIGAFYRSRMGTHFPAMTLVEVSALLESGAKVEIEATAAIPSRPRKNLELEALKKKLEKVNAKANWGLFT